MPFFKITYNQKYRFATLYNTGSTARYAATGCIAVPVVYQGKSIRSPSDSSPWIT
jgi:hypothetical protein